MRSKLHIVLLLMLAAACTKDPGFSGLDPESGRPTVAVTFHLAVAPEEPATKGSFDPDEPGYDASTAIRTASCPCSTPSAPRRSCPRRSSW